MSPRRPSMPTQEKPNRKPAKTPFEARTSVLDYETMLAKNQPFRGFFTLFWVTMAAGVLVTIIKNFSTHGTLVSLRLAVQMSKNGVELVASDIAMVASMFICIPIMKLIVAAPLPRFFVTATYLAYELVWLSLWVTWVVYNEWEWTQSGAFTMHIISMLMKQHSYLTYNTELAYKYKVYQAAITIAATSKKLDSQDEANSTTNLAELKHELVKETVSFPANLTLYKFADYVALPTLVYELEYPRTSSFRLWYFLERCLTTVTTISLAYIVMEHYIYPVLNLLPEQSVVESLVSLLIPCMLLWILLFYVIFECICNASAELTYFADRHFYADWWNSSSFDEFARNWNKPVHEFLLRHVYLESIDTYKLSKTNATFMTFFLSSVLHELVLSVIGKRIRMYFFACQMTQLPLIMISKIPFVKRQKTVGNVVFWVGMYLGPPLLCVLYLRDAYST